MNYSLKIYNSDNVIFKCADNDNCENFRNRIAA